MSHPQRRAGRIRLTLFVGAIAMLVLATLPAAPRGAAPAEAATLAFGSRLINLPMLRGSGTPPPPPPAALSANLALRPVPLEEVERGEDESVEFRYQNTGTTVISSAIFSVYYPDQLATFENTDLAAGDVRVNHDATRVIVQVFNVVPGETRTGRVNFFVRRSADEGARIGFYATYECQTPGNLCRSNLAEVEVLRNDDEDSGAGGTFTMTVSPDQGPPGTAHTFYGTYFSPGEEVITWLNTSTGAYPLPVTTTADENGAIRIIYGTGGLVPGYYSLVAHGKRSNTEGVGAFFVAQPVLNGLAETALGGAVALPGALALPPVAEQSGGEGGVAGTITGPDGQGLGGVPVEVRDSTGALAATALSRADGTYFVARGLRSGQYVVLAKPRQSTLPGLGFFAEASRGPVAVEAPELTRGIDLSLPAAGAIAGATQSELGSLGGVRVVALNAAGEVVGADVSATPSGAFLITNLPPGTYTVRFDPRNLARGGNLAVTRRENVVVTAGNTTQLPAPLSRSVRTGEISGRVTAASSPQGIEDVVVLLREESSGFVAVAHTDSDGNYNSGALPAGSYRIQFLTAVSEIGATTRYLGEFYDDATSLASATPVTLAAGEAKTAIDAGLAPGGVISGVVTGASAPLAGVFVVAVGADGVPAALGRSDASGRYSLGGLRAGDYTVEFITRFAPNETTRGFPGASYDPNGLTPPNPTPVTVALGAETAGISVDLAAGVRFSGVVSGEDTGEGLAGVFVLIYEAGTGAPVAAALTDSAGSYTTPALRPALYKLRFTTLFSPNPLARLYADEYFNNARTLDAAQAVGLVAPGPRQVNVALTPGGTISGRVTAEGSGQGLAGVFVVARLGGQVQGVVTTDETGFYSVPGLPAGSYSVEFITRAAPEPAVRAYAGELYDDQPPDGTPTPVNVVAAQDTVGIDAALVLAP